jgi:hypothetical protein
MRGSWSSKADTPSGRENHCDKPRDLVRCIAARGGLTRCHSRADCRLKSSTTALTAQEIIGIPLSNLTFKSSLRDRLRAPRSMSSKLCGAYLSGINKKTIWSHTLSQQRFRTNESGLRIWPTRQSIERSAIQGELSPALGIRCLCSPFIGFTGKDSLADSNHMFNFMMDSSNAWLTRYKRWKDSGRRYSLGPQNLKILVTPS